MRTRARAEYTLDPSRTLVTFEMRSLGTTQRGEFGRATGTVMLDSAEERGAIDIVIDARSLKANTEATAKFVRRPVVAEHRGASRDRLPGAAHRIFRRPAGADRRRADPARRHATRRADVSDYDCNGEIDQRCTLVATANVKRSAFGMTRYRMFASDEVKLAIQAEGVSRSTSATRS